MLTFGQNRPSADLFNKNTPLIRKSAQIRGGILIKGGILNNNTTDCKFMIFNIPFWIILNYFYFILFLNYFRRIGSGGWRRHGEIMIGVTPCIFLKFCCVSERSYLGTLESQLSVPEIFEKSGGSLKYGPKETMYCTVPKELCQASWNLRSKETGALSLLMLSDISFNEPSCFSRSK